MIRTALVLLLILPVALSAQGKMNEANLKKLLAADKTAVVLDVRTDEEFAAGHLPMAQLLPYDAINAKSASQVIVKKDTKVVVYCRSGRRSEIASQTLRGLGYTQVFDLGAYTNWTGQLAQGMPAGP